MRWPLEFAEAIAKEFVLCLQPACLKIEIAGSIRRRKVSVGDIEILYAPILLETKAVDDMFSSRIVAQTEAVFETLIATQMLFKRYSITGKAIWGEKNKLGLTRHGIPIDFFATTLENWWVSLVVRTGSKETNLRLTTGAQKKGRSLNAYGSGVTCSDGTVIPATSERHVFELCGVPYLPVEKR